MHLNPPSLKSPYLLLFLFVLGLALPAAAADSGSRAVRFDSAQLASTARQVEMGDVLRVDGLSMGLDKAEDALELKRVRVFSDDAQIVFHTQTGIEMLDLPRNVYFRGSIVGQPRSRVSLAVRESGEVRGIVAADNRHWLLMTDKVDKNFGPLLAHEVDPTTGAAERASGFDCETDKLNGVHGGGPSSSASDHPLALANLSPDPHFSAQVKAQARSGGNPSFTVRVAIETDFEYFNKFGNATDATDYIGDVFGFMSGIYADEVDTSILVSSVSLWSTAADPWTETNSLCALFQFGKHWNDNNESVDRTIAHLFSGKNTNSGVAWVGVLCRDGSTQTVNVSNCNTLTEPTDNYVGGYGFTGGIDGNFNPSNPSVIWDIAGTSHEIGHNFNSPHTHCWNGQAGGGPNVDECWGSQTGCYDGTPTLPAGCPGTGNGCGTIMSYCHLSFGGGFSNVSLTLGTGHPFGTDPGRVPSRMNAHVLSQAASGCVDFTQLGEIFADGFESGNTSQWSLTEP